MIALEPFSTPRETLHRLLDRLLPDLSAGANVLVKPEWCARARPRPAENTSPAFIEALLSWLDARGARVALAHSSLLTPPDVPYMSFTDLLKLEGVDYLMEDFPHVRLIDLETEPMRLRRSGEVELLAPATLDEVDLFIHCARLKTHMATTIAVGTKGLMGLLPDSENLRMHRDGLDRLLAHLGDAVAPSLTLVEADVGMEGNGPHHGQDVACGIYFGGDDLLAVDSAAAGLMGFEPADVAHLVGLAALQGRDLPGLPEEWKRWVRPFAPAGDHLQHKKVTVWPGDSCATCHLAAASVEDHVRSNPHHLGDLAAVASMLYMRGFHIFMGHHDPERPPPEGQASVAVGACAAEWAQAHGVPLVPGCPVRYHQVQPTLMQLIRDMSRGRLEAGSS
ncbi:MAG: DUF362 domain-containing protein [Alphaproteobacteria bacterium]|nr:DUF362 domain-containing protein [Alphaproteobacteria bacterium]